MPRFLIEAYNEDGSLDNERRITAVNANEAVIEAVGSCSILALKEGVGIRVYELPELEMQYEARYTGPAGTKLKVWRKTLEVIHERR